MYINAPEHYFPQAQSTVGTPRSFFLDQADLKVNIFIICVENK